MNYVVGDIHGEIGKLEKLINKIINSSYDVEITFVGDYLDKGEDSKQTLKFLNELMKLSKCSFLMGNHEYLWEQLNAKNTEIQDYLLRYGARMTMRSFNSDNMLETKEKIFDEYGHFLKNLIPYKKIGKYMIVHSGIPPHLFNTSADKIHLKEFLFNRYDFIRQECLYESEYRIIFGHTGFYFPYVDRYKIGIDTAACFLETQPLSAYSIEEELFIDSNNSIKDLSDCNLMLCPNIVRKHPWRELQN